MARPALRDAHLAGLSGALRAKPSEVRRVGGPSSLALPCTFIRTASLGCRVLDKPSFPQLSG